MIDDIVDALEELTNWDNSEYLHKIYVYLYNAIDDKNELWRMQSRIGSHMVSMNLCPKCGHELGEIKHKELHDELDEKPYEIWYEKYCPNCGEVDE